MTLLTTIIFFIFGLVIGSFLNVVICRYNTGQTFRGRSVCLSCQAHLCWYELIPLLSFLALGGRCRTCQTKISRQYPAVEIITGILFAFLYLKLESLFYFDISVFFATYAYYAVLFSLLIIIAFYDARHKIIPDPLAVLFGTLSFLGLFLFTEGRLELHLPAWKELLSGFAVAVPFALLWLISRGTWMGLGDAKLALGLGWMLGISRIVSATVLAFWSGALLSVVLLLFSKKYKIKSEIPFAPFLIFGALIAFFFELNVYPLF